MLSIYSKHDSFEKMQHIRQKYGDKFPKERYADLNREELFDNQTPMIHVGEDDQLLFQTQWASINSYLEYSRRLHSVKEIEHVYNYYRIKAEIIALNTLPYGMICPHVPGIVNDEIEKYIENLLKGKNDVTFNYEAVIKQHLPECQGLIKGSYPFEGYEKEEDFKEMINEGLMEMVDLASIRTKYKDAIILDRYIELNRLNILDKQLPIYHMDGDQLWYQTAWGESQSKQDYPFKMMVVLNLYSIQQRCYKMLATLHISKHYGDNTIGKKCTHMEEIVKEAIEKHIDRLDYKVHENDYYFYYIEKFYKHMYRECKD
jgi:hypothetical protein